MAYTHRNFRTKKALKEAVAQVGSVVTCREMTPWGPKPITDGTAFIEGPHAPEPHNWYARAEVKNGRIVSVK